MCLKVSHDIHREKLRRSEKVEGFRLSLIYLREFRICKSCVGEDLKGNRCIPGNSKISRAASPPRPRPSDQDLGENLERQTRTHVIPS